MKTFKLAAVIFCSLVLLPVVSVGAEAPAAVTLTPWPSAESRTRFQRADKADFFSLAGQFEGQENKFYCGPTSAVIVLNALRANNPKAVRPTDPQLYRGSKATLPKDYNPVFERYTQDAFFSEKTDSIKTRAQAFGAPMDASKPDAHDYGLTLRQLSSMLQAYGVHADMHIVDDQADAKAIRKDLVANLKHEGDYVIVNYARKSLGQNGGGHISPLAAYDAKTDTVLVLDVNPAHQPWVWVKVDDMIAAMRTKDTGENRGYVLVSEAAE